MIDDDEVICPYERSGQLVISDVPSLDQGDEMSGGGFPLPSSASNVYERLAQGRTYDTIYIYINDKIDTIYSLVFPDFATLVYGLVFIGHYRYSGPHATRDDS